MKPRRGSATPKVAALVAGLVIGCSSPKTIETIPADVAYVALIAIDGTRVIDASRLRTGDDAVTFFGPDGRDLAVVGYSTEPLTTWIRRFANGELPTERLRQAADCEASLPEPVWFARSLDGRGFTNAPADEAPPMTADWLDGRCDQLEAESVSVNVACTALACVETRRKTGPCRFEVDLGRCDQPPVEVLARPDGSACIAPSPDRTCTPASPFIEAAASLSCRVQTTRGTIIDACLTDIYFTPSPQLQVVAERTITSLDNIPGWASGRGTPILKSDDLRRGPLLDIVVRANTVAILGLPADDTSAEARCRPALRPRTLYLLDPFDLGTTASVMLPDCAEHLIRDPAGPGFFYAAPDLDGGPWRVVRTDADGLSIESRPLPIAPDAFVQDLHPAEDGSERLFALILDEPISGATTATIVEIDAATLATRSVGIEGRFSSLASLESGDLILGSQRIGRIEFVRGPINDLNRERTPFDFPGEGRKDLRVIGMSSTGFDLSAAVAVSGNQTGIVAWNPQSTRAAGPLDVDFQPAVVARWPTQPGRVLIGGVTTQGVTRGILHAFDVPTARLVPGPVYFGEGATTAIDTSSTGEVYALFGWTGRVVRLTSVAREPR